MEDREKRFQSEDEYVTSWIPGENNQLKHVGRPSFIAACGDFRTIYRWSRRNVCVLLSRAKAKTPTAKQYHGVPRPNLPIRAMITIRTGDIIRAAVALSRELTPPAFRIDISRFGI